MDDLTGRGTSAGPVTTTGRIAHVDDDRDWHESASEMTAIIPIDESATSWDSTDWHSTAWERHYRPTRSEITQDILIPESEFDAYRDDPFDIDGAHPDSVTLTATEADAALSVIDDEKPFRTRPATAGETTRRGGRHRIAAPPTALKGGRAALIAMAAGAAVAAAAVATTDSTTTPTNAANVDPAGQAPDLGPGVAAANPAKDMDTFTDQLAVGKDLASAKEARENLLRRPMFMSPLPLGQYQFTSTFAMRWGSFHGGVDFAAPLGTPIHAATDGVVIEAGPASGYGNWVQVRANDGTVTMYGHMASSGVLVQKGQHVTAGDVIALVGSEGFSTGPHCHFEVWKNGTVKIDPAPWLAAHGVHMSAYVGG
ncbi:M23 family metallopeptidase [Gordonia sp. CPCC 205515]|uniref:M23 family metallopeptidase n=1 Tax=Gordonia sp. CPCC 205515 TaxID=3140791 RepID=UPI003AF3A7B0